MNIRKIIKQEVEKDGKYKVIPVPVEKQASVKSFLNLEDELNSQTRVLANIENESILLARDAVLD